jgi:hypothetical protein
MDNHLHHPEVTEIEQRLARWQPAADELDADALLFAAGQAAARRGAMRYAWPALTSMLAAVVIVLGLWLHDERSERLALARQQMPPSSVATPAAQHEPAPADTSAPPSAELPAELPPSSLLASHRALEGQLDAWSGLGPDGAATGPQPSRSAVLQVRQRSLLTDP